MAGEDDAGRRLDRVLRKMLPTLPLSGIHRLIRSGKIRVDGAKAGPGLKLNAGSRISLPEGLAKEVTPIISVQSHRDGARRLSILWEDDQLLVLSKPVGTLTHGIDGLDVLVLDYLRSNLSSSLAFKPGPLHRLDRNTSGAVVFSKSLVGARTFSEAMAARRIRKRYLALLEGELSSPGRWEDSIVREEDRGVSRVSPGPEEERNGGVAKEAYASVHPLATEGGRTLALVELGSGRTHQIRVQAAARGYPLLGDSKYGSPSRLGTYFLHAYELWLPEEVAKEAPRPLMAPLPDRFMEVVSSSFGVALATFLRQAPPTSALQNGIV